MTQRAEVSADSLASVIRTGALGPSLSVSEVFEAGAHSFPASSTPEVAIARVAIAGPSRGPRDTMIFRFERQRPEGAAEHVIVDWWADRASERHVDIAKRAFAAYLAPRTVQFREQTSLGDLYQYDAAVRRLAEDESGATSAERIWRWRDQPVEDVQLRTRAIGLESEYAHVLREDRRPRPDDFAKVPTAVLERFTPSPMNSGFLPNGARAYPDVGHLEYATPECVSPMDLVASVLAGDMMVDAAARRTEQQGRSAFETEKPIEVRFLRRCTDWQGNTHAAHENYQMAKGVTRDDLDLHLPPFLASRLVVVGPGGFSDSYSDGLVLDARALHIKGWAASSVHAGKLHMLKTSDEAHDLDTGGWRLQIAGADANVMQVPLFLRFALTHLVLRQIESRASGFSSLTLVDSTKAVKMLSVDPALTKTVTLVDGRELTGLNLQEAYLEKTLRFCDYEEVTDEERFAVELWAGIVDDLRTAPGKAADRVEWVAKHRAIVEFAERRGLGRTGERYLDLSWTDIRNDRGVRAPLEAAGAVRMLVDPARVVERTHTPPNTRAAVRGSIIRAIRRRELDASVDWSFASFSVNNPEHATVSNAAKQAKVSLGDPRFNVRSAELEATEARARVRRSEGRP